MRAILFSATANSAVSQQFYAEKLGLEFISDGPFALVFSCNGTMLRIQKVEKVVIAPYTSLGFEVANLAQKVAELVKNGIEFDRYDFLEQDDNGIWTSPDGAQIAWCKDPEGHTISFSQHPD